MRHIPQVATPHFPMLSRIVAVMFSALPLVAADSWPSDVKEIRVHSTADQTEQPGLWWTPADTGEPRPLLVGLHTWSSDSRQTGSSSPYLQWCRQQGWHFIHPNFRGMNRTPEALGSDLAVQDIVDAVAWAKANAKIDARRIYLIGVSGGGHMSMLMAARHPEIWAGVSAWCGIVDIARWHAEHSPSGKSDRYASEIEKALGGLPDNDARKKDARRRSPLTWLAAAREVPLDIAAGVHDGRKGSVPFRHSLDAFNAVVPVSARMTDRALDTFYETQKLPDGWTAPPADPLFGTRQPVFRKTHDNTRVTIFEGAHEIVHEAALNWLMLQEKGRPTVWDVESPVRLHVDAKQTKSGL